MTARKQADTRGVSLRSIVASREFARGLDEVRKGLPFNPDNDRWNYERGRAFGFIAPLDMPLRIGNALNPKALKLARGAFSRSFCYEEGKKDQGFYTSASAGSAHRTITQSAASRNHRPARRSTVWACPIAPSRAPDDRSLQLMDDGLSLEAVRGRNLAIEYPLARGPL